MKTWIWALFGMAIGATAAYILLKPQEENQEEFPLFVMKKAKGSINDEVFAGVKNNDDENWI